MKTNVIIRAVQKIALAQHGAFTSTQAFACGVTPSMLRTRLRTGEWAVAVSGVYILTGHPGGWRQRLMVAVLAVGEGAAISHFAALALWGLPGFRESRVEIVAPHGRRHHRLKNVTFHESRNLPTSHIKHRDGIPVLCIERVLCDLAHRMHFKRLERAVDNAITRNLTTAEKLWEMWAEMCGRGRPGMHAMHKVLLKRGPGYIAPESELEARFIDLLEQYGIEQPERQVNLGAEEWIGRVDFLYRRAKLIIELDGRVGHDGELDRTRDRLRDRALTAAGFHIMHVKWEDLVLNPAGVVADIRTVLARAA
ncbi:MAG: DUF559 domain-containing protein [Actinobacteria bacterium]|nr:DUF559 domain-containing protein [Actinomycetota bacterium]MBV8961064.1 DUF559 domain-containing protein [Actinomycetota bacterium]MBV9252720.1 DUF559 domain-containing protein [Actinomycetota bacterium]MBV9662800.1 DUF559 domain-containing protein [Actinomycetota bacterium]MBV9933072.1 DUF559 domain-containing protein [Actinomycetota bacterium]